MKVVLDTNVLASGIFFQGSPVAGILDVWLKQKLDVYATPEILKEYRRVIEEFGLIREPVLEHDWTTLVPELCYVIPDEASPRRISRDPTDDKFLSCAARAGVQYLVTGDQDLKSLKEEFLFKIVTPAEFLKILKPLF